MTGPSKQSSPLDQEPHKPKALVKLETRWSQDTLVCVGLDSEYPRIPQTVRDLRTEHRAIQEFNRRLVDATHDLACAYKLNLAFYEAEGIDGLEALGSTMSHIEGVAPSVLRLVDGKRADIGNTNRGYARFLFDSLHADAITVSPYLGSSFLKDGERKLESLLPFLERQDNLVFVLCRTSNEDAGEFQDLPIALNELSSEYKARFGGLEDLRDRLESNTAPLFLVLAHKLARDWNANGNVGLVVGATYPQELAPIRRIVGDMPILLPGIGAQEGDAQASVQAGIDSKRQGLVINSSREIIFASQGEDYAQVARKVTLAFRDRINQYRLTA